MYNIYEEFQEFFLVVFNHIEVWIRVRLFACHLLEFYLFLCAKNCIVLFVYLLVMGTNPNFTSFVDLMKRPIGARILPTIALVVLLIDFKMPPPIVGLVI